MSVSIGSLETPAYACKLGIWLEAKLKNSREYRRSILEDEVKRFDVRKRTLTLPSILRDMLAHNVSSVIHAMIDLRELEVKLHKIRALPPPPMPYLEYALRYVTLVM